MPTLSTPHPACHPASHHIKLYCPPCLFEAFLIVDEFEAVWKVISKPSSGKRRVDIILDNSGEGWEERGGKGWEQGRCLGSRPGETEQGILLLMPFPCRLDPSLQAGLELYSDLCLADVLVQYGLADEVVFHGKPFAWFVSDTTLQDFGETLELCSAPVSRLQLPSRVNASLGDVQHL
jgi:hypothetical protein